MTPYQEFSRRWGTGCGHTQCEKATRIVLARGTVPCDILLVGESPGQSEDVLGAPFKGPAGRVIDRIVRRSIEQDCDGGGFCRWTWAFTNLTGCYPRDEEGAKAEPDEDQVLSCKPRLEEFIALANPKMIVCVGALSRKWFEQGYKVSVKVPRGVKIIDIVHPAAILRANSANQGLLEQRAAVTISSALEDLEP